MNTLLYITSSIFGEQGQSTRLADTFVKSIQERHPGLNVLARDLNAEPVPHLNEQRFAAFLTAKEERSPEAREIVAFSDALIDEWRRSDVVVIALPMYNLGVPSSFKAYIDHIARAGETFRYTAEGPVGLLKDRKVHVIATRGGQYVGTSLDTQTPYLKHILGLIGISDVEFTYAEGLNMSDSHAMSALEAAGDELSAKAA